MTCPNCGNDGYTNPGPCGVCQWEPVLESDPSEGETAEPSEGGAGDVMMNLMVSLGFGVVFFVLFYIFPSKHQSDWFHFQISDVIGGAILSVIGFVGLEKVKD